MKKQLGAQDILFPVPAALIVGGTTEKMDVATIAWVGMVSSTPPTIGVSFDKRRYTLELIQATKEFTVNIPSADLVIETDYCGLVSGRGLNKFTKADLTPIPSQRIQTPIIEECPFNLECRVTQEVQLGDFVLVMGEVVETHIDQDKVFAVDRDVKIDIAKVNPLVYCPTIREYWSIGNKLGNAFQIGKELL